MVFSSAILEIGNTFQESLSTKVYYTNVYHSQNFSDVIYKMQSF